MGKVPSPHRGALGLVTREVASLPRILFEKYEYLTDFTYRIAKAESRYMITPEIVIMYDPLCCASMEYARRMESHESKGCTAFLVSAELETLISIQRF